MTDPTDPLTGGAAAGDFEPAVVATRSGVRETVHWATVVGLAADGSVALAVGNPEALVYPRSSMKPLQAAAMVGLGLSLPPDLLALACASHDGSPMHVDGVRRLLHSFGLDENALGNIASMPLDPAAAEAVLRAGGGPTRLQMNCSGKHAAMLATCVVNGWPADVSYLSPEHPLQQAITAALPAWTGAAAAHIGVDGCGAPAHVMTLIEVARAYRAIATGGAGVAVPSAMMSHPELVGGPRRDVTVLMRSIPGLVAKDGADGVYTAALPDGRAVALKVADGSPRARIPLMIAALAQLGVDVGAVPESTWRVPVLGHGRPVGDLRPIGRLATAWPPSRPGPGRS
jgi:L-asparaginase II